MTVEEVLGDGLGREVYTVLARHLGDRAQERVSRTQVGWARKRGFAFLWSPQRWQGPSAAPLVLTLAFTEVEPSSRWKEVYRVRPGLWNHHLEIRDIQTVDAEVMEWLDRAWDQAR